MPLLEINNLTKSFAAPSGEKTLIVDVPSFSLEEGAQVALEGASGSGKTTFLNLIAGILQADGGTIRVAGQEMTALAEPGRDRLRAATIGYVFQTFNLLQGYTALENVALGMAFGRGVDGPHALALLQRVGLNERMTYRPRQLSVGQQQRVAVARALATGNPILLADEPTGELDFRAGVQILELLARSVGPGRAVIIVTHNREISRIADRVVEVSGGAVVADGPPAGGKVAVAALRW